MPRDGAIVLSDLRTPFLQVVCEPCGRRERYAVARLLAERGDAKLTDLLRDLAQCEKARCKAVYAALALV
jgi:hypothetical protein